MWLQLNKFNYGIIKPMKTSIRSLFAATALVVATSASATVVTATQTQTVNAQDFTFALATPGYAANTSSTLSVRVQGDFNGESGEFVTVWIEGNNVGTFGITSSGVYDLVDYRSGTGNFNALAFSLDFVLAGADTNAYLADGDLDVLVDFNSGVTANCGWSNTENCLTNVGTAPFAQVSLDYQTAAVPEPASMALFGLGLLGVAALRGRKAK